MDHDNYVMCVCKLVFLTRLGVSVKVSAKDLQLNDDEKEGRGIW